MTIQNLFSVDGKFYDVSIDALKINGEKVSSDDTGRLKNLDMYIKFDGIFVNYELTLSKRNNDNKEFFSLFHHLTFDKSNPQHDVKLPYGNKLYSFKAYCPQTSVDIERFLGTEKYDRYGQITIQFISISKAVSPL